MGKRVLLVYDDRHFQASAVAALTAAAFDVTACDNSFEALNILDGLTSPHFDVLVTRVQFSTPAPHGVALWLMAGRAGRVRRVVFTARSDAVAIALSEGAVLEEPVSLEALVSTVWK